MTKILLWIVASSAIFAIVAGCEHTNKPRGLSGNERAFHLEHGAGAYTPRYHQHYRWAQ